MAPWQGRRPRLARYRSSAILCAGENRMTKPGGEVALVGIVLIPVAVILSSCSSFDLWGSGTAPPGFGNAAKDPPSSPAGHVVTVDYEVSCTRCEVGFTNSQGDLENGGERGGRWRHRERISSAVGSVVVTADPRGAGMRITVVRVLVDGSLRAWVDLPPGGSTDPVALRASLVTEPAGPLERER